MPDTERKVLPGHSPRGLSTTSGVAPVLLMLFGLPFMGVGVLSVFIMRGANASSRPSGMPGWIGWAVAAIFFVPGAFVFAFGFKGLFDAARLRRAREQHSNEPWLAEYPWDPEGISADSRASVLSQVLVMAFLLVFLAPFNYFVFFSPDSPSVPLMPRGLVAFFDLIPVLMLWGIVTTLWRANKYGRARLAFGSFPFYLGGSMSARLSTPRPIGEFKRISFTLRCVEERTVVYSSRRTSTSSQTTCEQIWVDELVLDQPGALYDGEFPLSFRLPDGDYASRFMDPPGRYWELEVKADTAGMDFAALFLLPVYARPHF
jgi:hypothetical protein